MFVEIPKGASVALLSGMGLVTGMYAYAQTNPDQPGATQSAQLETVIVTGDRPELNTIPMQAQFSESAITPEAILNITPSPATTVQTLLNTQPSIYATTGATNGMETTIKFRSFSDGEFGETVAGVPLNDLFNSGVTYQADNRNNVLFITRDLDSVNLYRGVNNPAVNTYNSLGGTINYIPRQPTDTASGDVGADFGSFGTIDYHATINTGAWHGIKQTASVEVDDSQGWLQNTTDRNLNVYYAGNAKIAGNSEGFGYFIYNRNHGNAPQFIPQNILNNQVDFQWPTNLYRSDNLDKNYLGILGFKTEVGNILTIEDEAYVGDNNYTRTSFSNPNYTGPYFIDDQGSGYPFWTGYTGYDGFTKFPYTGTQAYGVSTGASGYGCAPTCAFAGTDYHFYGYDGSSYGDRLKISAELPYNTVTGGGDLNYGRLHSREYWYGSANMPMIVGYNDAWDERDTRTMWSVYAQDGIHFWNDRARITPGVKYIKARTTDIDALGFYYSAPGPDRGSENFVSPTVGASVEPIRDFTIYGAYGKNVKFPDITAFYNAIAGSNTAPIVVKPEYAKDYEFGLRYQAGKLTAALNGYQEDFSQIIFSSATAAGFTQYQNGGSERYRGVEMQLTDEFGHFLVGELKGYVNASYNKAICTSSTKSDLTGQNCDSGQSLPNVPKVLANVGLIWDFSGWHVDVEGQYVGPQGLASYFTNLPVAPGELEPGQRTQIPSYFLVSTGVIKVIPLNWSLAKAVRFALHVDNLFDKRYFSSAQVNIRNRDTTGANQAEDFYGLSGEPIAVFGSIAIYF
ncbi:MAG TPA: TonB-dependent receptor [Steroidobacteraceae bacterium]|nr:TonB-dependent receptor [Steroidobacteraceae bacterium]